MFSINKLNETRSDIRIFNSKHRIKLLSELQNFFYYTFDSDVCITACWSRSQNQTDQMQNHSSNSFIHHLLCYAYRLLLLLPRARTLSTRNIVWPPYSREYMLKGLPWPRAMSHKQTCVTSIHLNFLISVNEKVFASMHQRRPMTSHILCVGLYIENTEFILAMSIISIQFSTNQSIWNR